MNWNCDNCSNLIFNLKILGTSAFEYNGPTGTECSEASLIPHLIHWYVPVCDKRRLKRMAICGSETWKFRNFITTETSTTPRTRIDLTTTIFGYRKWIMADFWTQNTRFLHLERGLQWYKLDILRPSEAKWMSSGEYCSSSCISFLAPKFIHNRGYALKLAYEAFFTHGKRFP